MHDTQHEFFRAYVRIIIGMGAELRVLGLGFCLGERILVCHSTLPNLGARAKAATRMPANRGVTPLTGHPYMAGLKPAFRQNLLMTPRTWVILHLVLAQVNSFE